MYYKGKWCTAGGKDPLFGHVDGFQIGPKATPCLGRFSAVQFFGLVSSGASPARMASQCATLSSMYLAVAFASSTSMFDGFEDGKEKPETTEE